MMPRPLIQVAELQRLMSTPTARPLLIDCSFDLSRPAAGLAAFEAAHLPGAQWFSLDDDLSGAKTGRNGRHPLPDRAAFAARLAAAGTDDDTPVVVYDGSGGMYAARAWWMLRWAGHAEVAQLDGGLAAWRAAGLPLESGPAAARAPGGFTLRPALVSTVGREVLLADAPPPGRRVIDARANDRFRGENETLDRIGGRIPGSRNRWFRDNLLADGRFKPAAQLRAEFEAVLQGQPAASMIHSCGSGVTACHNLLAMEIAGLGSAALYPGSWSEWSSWPDAPVATGPA